GDHAGVAEPAPDDELRSPERTRQHGVEGATVNLARNGGDRKKQREEARQVVHHVHAEQRERGEDDPERQSLLGGGAVFQGLVVSEVETERVQADERQADEYAGQNEAAADRLLQGEAGYLKDIPRPHRSKTRTP